MWRRRYIILLPSLTLTYTIIPNWQPNVKFFSILHPSSCSVPSSIGGHQPSHQNTNPSTAQLESAPSVWLGVLMLQPWCVGLQGMGLMWWYVRHVSGTLQQFHFYSLHLFVYVWIRVYSHLKTLQSYYNIFWRVCQVFLLHVPSWARPERHGKSGSGMVCAWILCGMAFACGVFGGFVCGMLDIRC